MTNPSSIHITLTPDELKSLIHDAVRDALLEGLGEDMNTELNFAPEIAERLSQYRTERPKTIPADTVAKELGFDV